MGTNRARPQYRAEQVTIMLIEVVRRINRLVMLMFWLLCVLRALCMGYRIKG